MEFLFIFVSSRTEELKDERKALKKLLESISNKIHVFIFERDASASKFTSQEVYRREVSQSHIYIGIFKNEYSSATEEEYQLAIDENKDILIYVYDTEDGKKDEKLNTLVKKFKKSHVINKFTTIEELEEKVRKDVMSLLIEKYNLAEAKIDLGEIKYYPPSYFETHTIGNLEQWKKGFSFNLVSINNGEELRRDAVINDIITRITQDNVLLLIGPAGYSKTTLLYETVCYFHKNNHLTFMIDGSVGISDINKIIESIELLLATGKKVFIAVDNAHAYGALPIFTIIDSLASNTNFGNVKFLLSARSNEIVSLMEYKYVGVTSQQMESIIKIVGDTKKIFNVPGFNKLVIKKFILKYQQRRFSNEKELDKFACSILDQTNGHPVLVRFLILGTGFKEHVKSIKNEYLNSDSRLITMITCSLLSFSDVRITDSMLRKMKLIDTAFTLENATLLHDEGIWKTLHVSWDRYFFSLLFLHIKSFHKNKKYLKKSLDTIFNLRDEQIVLSVLRQIYSMPIEKILSFDFVEKIIIPSYVSNTVRPYLIAILGYAYEQVSNFDKALEKYQKAIKIDPTIPQILHEAAYCFHMIGNDAEAVKFYDRAIQIAPDMPYPYINAATSLGRLRRYDEGINLTTIGLDKSSKLNNPRVTSALFLNRGFVKMGKGDLQEAEKDFNKSLDVNEDSPAYSNLARVYFLRRDFKTAIDYCNKAITLDPRDEIATEYKINSLKMLGLDDEAEKTFDILKKQNPKFYNELRNFFLQHDWRIKIEHIFWARKYN